MMNTAHRSVGISSPTSSQEPLFIPDVTWYDDLDPQDLEYLDRLLACQDDSTSTCEPISDITIRAEHKDECDDDFRRSKLHIVFDRNCRDWVHMGMSIQGNTEPEASRLRTDDAF
ncbi:unnamed protein product [Phytophthora fragariaefolia]|uniref:Unnamed protein product n=1 Tax=Phytophthora fragariaefolia TaxID=1490495 RepID=A0A9W6TRY7_9STRA|nr:unnamed protein product [Phytophthora fragariaefolia]